MAIFDGAVAVLDSKYFYDLWRPVTAIRGGDSDGNHGTTADPDWLPLVFTLPFPRYPSGHGGMGNAARRVVEDAYGPAGNAIELSNPAIPEVVLQYSSFRQISDDIDDARVYGGVHFRFDQEEVTRLGRRVGSYILRHQLRPRRERSAAPDTQQPPAQVMPAPTTMPEQASRRSAAGETRDATASR